MRARELDELRALESVAAAEPVPEPSPFLFTRALARVEEYERHRARRHWWQLSPALAATVIAAQFVLILFAAALLVNRQRQFESLAAELLVEPPRAPRIVLGFQDGVSEQTVRQVVRGLSGTIVAGPSALGLYTVELPPGCDVDRVLDQLRQNSAVVRLPAAQP